MRAATVGKERVSAGPERDRPILRIVPGDRRHVGLLARSQLDQIGAPVGVDDKVGLDRRPGRLDQDVDASGIAASAFGIADDPAHGVAGRDRSRSRELLAGLERDVGDLSGRGIDLIERAGAVRKHLHGVEVSLLARFDARGIVRGLNPGNRSFGLLRSVLAALGRRPGRRNVKRPRSVVRVQRRTGSGGTSAS